MLTMIVHLHHSHLSELSCSLDKSLVGEVAVLGAAGKLLRIIHAGGGQKLLLLDPTSKRSSTTEQPYLALH